VLTHLLESTSRALVAVEPWVTLDVRKTILLVLVVGLGRFAVGRAVLRWTRHSSPEERRRGVVAVRNVAILVLITGGVTIWAEELQSIVFSLVAVAAALVLAFKEIINGLSGSFVRSTTKAFQIGDRIEVNGQRGDVIDHTLLSTTLLEVGPGQHSHQYTGRAVVLPNAWLLTHPTVNETFTHDYVLHPFTVAIGRGDDWEAAEAALLEAAAHECGPYLEDARSHFDRMARQHSFEPMSVDPRVLLRLGDPARIELLVRVPVPARRKGRVEQAILRRFLQAFQDTPEPLRPDPNPPSD
jgi:small-conductance mechanosensitive channel